MSFIYKGERARRSSVPGIRRNHVEGGSQLGSNALVVISVIGLYGFLGGLGIWLFYRMVRFAVEG